MRAPLWFLFALVSLNVCAFSANWLEAHAQSNLFTLVVSFEIFALAVIGTLTGVINGLNAI